MPTAEALLQLQLRNKPSGAPGSAPSPMGGPSSFFGGRTGRLFAAQAIPLTARGAVVTIQPTVVSFFYLISTIPTSKPNP